MANLWNLHDKLDPDMVNSWTKRMPDKFEIQSACFRKITVDGESTKLDWKRAGLKVGGIFWRLFQ